MIKDLTKFNRDLKNIVTWILEEMPHSKKSVISFGEGTTRINVVPFVMLINRE